jgi:hypothetical protein
VPTTAPVATDPAQQYKECPYCSEKILETAKKCKHCGEMLDPGLRQDGAVPVAEPDEEMSDEPCDAQHQEEPAVLGAGPYGRPANHDVRSEPAGPMVIGSALGTATLFGGVGLGLSQYWPVFGNMLERSPLAQPWSPVRINLIPIHLFAFTIVGAVFGGVIGYFRHQALSGRPPVGSARAYRRDAGGAVMLWVIALVVLFGGGIAVYLVLRESGTDLLKVQEHQADKRPTTNAPWREPAQRTIENDAGRFLQVDLYDKRNNPVDTLNLRAGSKESLPPEAHRAVVRVNGKGIVIRNKPIRISADENLVEVAK